VDECALLKDMLEIYSPTGKTGEIAKFLKEVAHKLGLEARVDEVGNFIAVKGSGRPEILLLGHMDTVEGKIPLRREGEILHGRGAVDAKGPLAAMLLAAARAGFPNGTVVVAGACDEEGESMGARHLAKSLKPDYAIIGEPSGWNGVTIGYKGNVKITYTITRPVHHTAGSAKTAPELAVEFWNHLEQHCSSSLETDDLGSGIFGSLSATIVSITTETTNLEITCTLKIDMRTPPGYSVEELKNTLEEMKGYGSFTIGDHLPAVLAEKNNPLVRAFLRSIRAQDSKAKFKKKTGTSDMNVIAESMCIPMVAYGPGDSSLDHTPEERMDLGELRKSIAVLVKVIEDLLSRKDNE
jgi:LysW-gamma-L-lysine carboxypeptidase